MKNLAHLPISILEENPSRLTMRWPHKFSLAPYKARHYIYPNHHSEKRNTLYRKIKNTIKGSVGKNWDEVHSKLIGYTKGIKFDFDINWAIKYDILIPIWSYKNQRWEVPPTYRFGHFYNVDLVEFIQKFRSRPNRYWPDKFYYVCPKSNIIRVVEAKGSLIRKGSDHWRRHYAFLVNRRKKYKEWRKRNEDHLLRMINNPELFKFYSRIVKEYRSELSERDRLLEKYLKEKENVAKGISKSRGWLNYAKRRLDDYDNHKHENFLKMESLRIQIEELEKGNFDCFFESAIYLYAQQKECHHFAQP